MVVARLSHGQPKVIDRLREMVRLAAGLDRRNRLSLESQQIALDCLSKFGERLRDINASSVRVVGTSTFRRIARSSKFFARASRALGHPLEIISGMEEARLIYQGVIHSSPWVDGEQMVVDIGGGSTEIICGTGLEAGAMESLHLGCVEISATYFGTGKLSRKRFSRARMHARLELEPIRFRFRQVAPRRVIGASGTIRAAFEVINNVSGQSGWITIDHLESLTETMIAAGHIDQLALPGLSEQRKPVFPGGIAILIEVMSALGMERMDVSDGALREGILYDLVGRLTNEDARVRTVRSMEGRFNIDSGQADRVESTAVMLINQVARSWGLKRESERMLLCWAARLHEIGLHISHSRYHQHGAYLLEHADMPGFSTEEQQVLAALVGAHRGKLQQRSFDALPKIWNRSARRLATLLRLAVLSNRSRTDVKNLELVCRTKGWKISIGVPEARAERSPLTWADLEREAKYLAEIGVKLSLNRLEPSL
jgi:exopolyphosphatase/guanosine-5'-triphosphate,3'-diphosphate pyrophosphatase